MHEYLQVFIDEEYPEFIDKYLNTKTLNRLRSVTQFCGSDYTNLYSPRFLYTRFNHSLVVAHMTWHFTHDKKETIAALLHDIGTPCFAHCIDYVFGDYMQQESSERSIATVVQEDQELQSYLKMDGITSTDLEETKQYPILENKSPKLCTDRLDGVLHTCYIWLHTHPLNEISEVYSDLIVLENEDSQKEIGFKTKDKAEKFTSMVEIYAKELQGNTDKFVMQYISEAVKRLLSLGLIEKEDLYTKKESQIVDLLALNIPSWESFTNATNIERTTAAPDNFYISFNTKKRNTIPLVKTEQEPKRIDTIIPTVQDTYQKIATYKDTKYAYVKSIKTI